MDSMIFVGPFQLNYSTAKRMPKGTEDFFCLVFIKKASCDTDFHLLKKKNKPTSLDKQPRSKDLTGGMPWQQAQQPALTSLCLD